MFVKSITNPEVNELELKSYEGPIRLIEDRGILKSVIKLILKYPYIGFDTETKPAFRKGEINEVSLIQFATPKEVFLIRVNKTGLTDGLISIFESKKVVKIGVALRDDIKDLQRLRPFDPSNFVELNHVVKDLGIESNGLRKLTAIILGFRISKSAQTSNWESAVLSKKQMSYAATDAWVCYQMYNKLVSRGFIEYSNLEEGS
ncbi:MAG: 3'-5' exonuclease [Bacteroidota bacterium]